MSPCTTNHLATVVLALVMSACRFGGPSGDPTLPSVDGAAGAAGSGGGAGQSGTGGQAGQVGTAGQAGQAGSGGASGGGGGTDAGGSAGATPDASLDIADDGIPDGGVDHDAWWDDVRADASDDASDGESEDTAPPTACLPPFSSAVCDPVCNTGCPPLLRCDVTDTPRIGVCVGTLLSPVTEGMACTRTAVTDDCIERLSCVEGVCRRLCYRDMDCATSGTCCNTSIDVDAGPSGYRFCAPCGP